LKAAPNGPADDHRSRCARRLSRVADADRDRHARRLPAQSRPLPGLQLRAERRPDAPWRPNLRLNALWQSPHPPERAPLGRARAKKGDLEPKSLEHLAARANPRASRARVAPVHELKVLMKQWKVVEDDAVDAGGRVAKAVLQEPNEEPNAQLKAGGMWNPPRSNGKLKDWIGLRCATQHWMKCYRVAPAGRESRATLVVRKCGVARVDVRSFRKIKR
jgi:hypothetical protein